MAVSQFQEKQLLDALQGYMDTKRLANKFVTNADKQTQLMGQISIIISRKLGISVTSAQAYIDARTGKFRDAGYMPYCTDPELKKLFSQLESVTTEINKCPWKTKADAVKTVAQKQSQVQRLVDEIKRQPGGQAVIDRVKSQLKGAAAEKNLFGTTIDVESIEPTRRTSKPKETQESVPVAQTEEAPVQRRAPKKTEDAPKKTEDAPAKETEDAQAEPPKPKTTRKKAPKKETPEVDLGIEMGM